MNARHLTKFARGHVSLHQEEKTSWEDANNWDDAQVLELETTNQMPIANNKETSLHKEDQKPYIL